MVSLLAFRNFNIFFGYMDSSLEVIPVKDLS